MASAGALPRNTARFSLAEIAHATGGSLSGGPEVSVEGVTTDTRSDARGQLFVALTGDRFDGHTFASAAARGGARALLVERDPGPVAVPVIRVRCTRTALGALGAYHRRRWGGSVVAVAGSAGKTTTKSAVAAALDAALPGAVHYAPGNLNNAIGVPLVLLGLSERHRYAVTEIGTNAPGEVRQLTALVEPDVAVLTLIGLEHTEGLGDLDGIEAEEGSLFSALGPNGVAIGNGDDARVVRQLGRAGASRSLRYGFDEGCDYRVQGRSTGADLVSRVSVSRPARSTLSVSSPLLGPPGALAIAAAIAAAEAATGAELDAERLMRAFSRLGLGEPGRLTPVALANGALVLDDTYNSNPASLTSSVAAAAEIARGRNGTLVLVLGEMRELGDDAPRLHREAAASLLEFGARRLVAVAGDARWFVDSFERARIPATFAGDAAAALALLRGDVGPNDVVLVKASRGVRAERIVAGLVEAGSVS